MRVRKKKNGAARFDARRDILINIDKNEPLAVDMHSYFPGKTNFRIELGCGKGSFIAEIAKRNPDAGFIALERVADVMIFAMENVHEHELENVRFIRGDAELLDKIFAPGTFEVIYINFCDPWPKARHEKRRLTGRRFLSMMAPLLAPGGRIEFKTDNRDLFDFSLSEFAAVGFDVRNITYDLHSSEYAADNIMTEYETNFTVKGYKINRCEAILINPVRQP